MNTHVTTAVEQEPAQQQLMLNPENPREREMILVEREFAMLQRKGQALAASSIIPKDFQNNLPNCMIAMEMAQRLNTGELEIMQNLYVIHGRPSFSASYLIAKVNNSSILKGRLKFEMVGEAGTDDYGCFAYGIDSDTEEKLCGTVITVRMAKAQGWWGKNGSKWPDMTDQMLQYRAASFWSRVYAPDATMGMHTVEEVQEIQEKEINPVGHQQLDSVQSMLAKAKASLEEEPATKVKVEEEPVVIVETALVETPTPAKRSLRKHSPAYTDIMRLIDTANTSADLDAVISLGGWDLLVEGEAPLLQKAIESVRGSLTDPK
jgi:hypothetical protein